MRIGIWHEQSVAAKSNQIRNTNLEIRNKFELRRRNAPNGLSYSVFGFYACFGFQNLYFEFFSASPVPDEKPHAPGTDCLWLLRFRPDQVYRAPLRGLLIGDRHETFNDCYVWHAIDKPGAACLCVGRYSFPTYLCSPCLLCFPVRGAGPSPAQSILTDEGDERLEERPRTGAAAADVRKNWRTWRQVCRARGCLLCLPEGIAASFLGCGEVPLRRQEVAI